MAIVCLPLSLSPPAGPEKSLLLPQQGRRWKKKISEFWSLKLWLKGSSDRGEYLILAFLGEVWFFGTHKLAVLASFTDKQEEKGEKLLGQ